MGARLNQQVYSDTCADMLAQDSYWNYGAASAKWVPPEHRARGRNGAAVPLHLAVKDACYTWDESAAAVRLLSCVNMLYAQMHHG